MDSNSSKNVKLFWTISFTREKTAEIVQTKYANAFLFHHNHFRVVLLHMPLNETLERESLAAHGATERLHLHVNPPVHAQGSGRLEHLAALTARKVPLVQVHGLVVFERFLGLELFAARFALGHRSHWSFGGTCVGFHVRMQCRLRGQLESAEWTHGFGLATPLGVFVEVQFAVKVHAAAFVFALVRFDICGGKFTVRLD